ncbi:hypothetical protein [Domibacillus tundrae]|uniref:hypothetical protein n=1 Tax=Domibacillus tundrae TaxID=1587527 RepID=UPI00155A3619|nr:hypothetical protein [Domibacillus tundrae]
MMERIYFIYKHAVPHKGSAKKREPLIEKRAGRFGLMSALSLAAAVLLTYR